MLVIVGKVFRKTAWVQYESAYVSFTPPRIIGFSLNGLLSSAVQNFREIIKLPRRGSKKTERKPTCIDFSMRDQIDGSFVSAWWLHTLV